MLGPKADTPRNTGSATDWTTSTTATWTGADANASGEAVIRSAAVVADAVIDIAEDCDVTMKGFVVEARNRTDSTNAHLIYVEAKNTTIQTVLIENNVIGPITGSAQDGAKGRFAVLFDSQSGGPNGASGLIKGNKIFGAEGNGANFCIIGQHYHPSMSDFSGMIVEDNDIYGSNRAGIEVAGGVRGLRIRSNAVLYNGYIWNGTSYVQSTVSLASPNNVVYGAGVNLTRTGTTCGVTPDNQNAIENVVLSGNTIAFNQKSGVYLDAQQRGTTITGNLINNNGRDGIWLDEFGTYNEAKVYNEAYGYIQGVTVASNTIAGVSSPYAAIKVTGKPEAPAVFNNILSANTIGVVQEDGAGQTWDYTLAAMSNFWGNANGPKSASNPLNAQTDGASAGATVAFFPWALNSDFTAYVTRSDYAITYAMLNMVMNEEQGVPVTFATAGTPGMIGYAAVRFAFSASGPGAVTFKASDSTGHEYTFVNGGYWGPASGFPLAADRTSTDTFKLTFAKAGTYDMSFRVFEVGHESTPFVTGNQQVVVAKATPAVTWPTATEITYAQTLGASTLNGGSATHAGLTVPGTFTFNAPETMPVAGTASQSVTFTPADTDNYNTVGGTVSVTVLKATPVVTWPVALTITYGATLAESSLTGGSASHGATAVDGTFAFTNPTIAPVAGTANQSVTFTPGDVDNYNPVVGNVSVTVEKSTSTVTTWPTASTILLGQSIGEAVLSGGAASVPGTFTFDAPGTKPAVGTANYAVTFTPADPSINTVSGSADVTVDNSMEVWVDDDFTDATAGWGVTKFKTIQGGINVVHVGGTVNVVAGTYAESLIVTKPLSLLGPNVGISPNGGSRVAEAVLLPDVSDIAWLEAIHVEASNVTVDGLTIDGDNPQLTSGFKGATGADLDACEAVTVYVDRVNNLRVVNNIIQNFSYFGVTIYGASYNAPATTGHVVENNLIRNMGTYDAASGVDYWGGGVLLYNSQYAKVVGNVMSNVRLGVQTGNFHSPNPGAATFQSISDNMIEARSLGIFHNLHTGSPSPYTLSGNVITAVADANETRWRGMLLGSLDVDCQVVDNVIDGSDANVPAVGYSVWNVAVTHSLTIQGGSVTGVDKGVWANNYEGYNSDAGYGAHATLSGLSISADEVGVLVWDSPSSTIHAAVAVALADGVSISDGAEGIQVAGTHASVTGIGNTVLAGQTVAYITLASGAMAGFELDATAATFEGELGSDMTLAELLAVEDKITHKVDDAALGLVRVKANELYVTIDSGSIQRGIDAATAGNTVYVGPGEFDGKVTLSKTVKLLSTDGLAATMIKNTAAVGYATVQITGPATGVQIGAVDHGFTVIGIDNASPGIEWAAIYLQGQLTDTTIAGNKIVAAGESGLTTEMGGNYVNLVITDNEFAGQTFIGLNPAGFGFADQFTLLNVPRQLVVVQNGTGPVTFSRNVVSGTAGGTNTAGQPQGNTLVTIDTPNATIADNVFSGVSARYATALRIGGSGDVVSGNEFRGLTPGGLFVRAAAAATAQVNNNSFVGFAAVASSAIENGGTALLNAQNNWFGSAVGPTAALNSGGNGGGVGANIDFSPWLADGDDKDDLAIGFQPDLSLVHYTPASLVFSIQPSDAFLGSALTPQPVVQVIDENGGVAVQFNGTITAGLATPVPGAPVAGVLNGTKTVTVTSGVATFTDLSITAGTGAGYRLVASATGLTPVTSTEFTIVNRAPVLGAIGNKNMDELVALTFTATATDADGAAQALTFGLTGTVPAGATINPSTGDFSWTPTEDQGVGTFTFTVVVTDNGAPAQSDFEEITVTVNEVNVKPALTGVPSSATIPEMVAYTFAAAATDADNTAQTLTFSLVGAPAGAGIDPSTGVFTWTPDEDQGPADYTFTVRVSDGVVNTDQSVTLHVTEVNVAPVLAAILPQSVNKGATLTFAASATDADLPANTLTYSMSGSYPAGAMIDESTGVFTWLATDDQAAYSFTVTVSDGTTTASQPVSISAVTATQDCPGFRSPSDNMVVSNSFTFGATPTGLTWTPVLPVGWTMKEADANGNGKAEVVGGAVVFTTLPTTSPVKFSYTVIVPGNAAVSNNLSAAVSFNGLTVQVAPMAIYRYHSADYQRDQSGAFVGQYRKIDSTELNRVLGYWRAGGYKPNPAGFDGFSSQAGFVGEASAGLHSADYDANKWQISMWEMLRVQSYWSAGGYHVNPAGADGYAPDRAGDGPRMLAALAEPLVSQTGPETYNPGQTVAITCTFAPGSAKILALGWNPKVPAGWTILSVSGDGTPVLVNGEILCTGTLPATLIRLTYTVRVPLTASGTAVMGGSAIAMANGMVNPESYAMDAIELTALDANGNGMADSWESVYAGGAGTLDPAADIDGDGMNNRNEYLSGTVPTDSASVLKMVTIKVLANGKTQVSWSSVVGHVYTLQRADGSPVTANFQDIRTGIQPDPSGYIVYEDAVDQSQARFYRVLCQ